VIPVTRAQGRIRFRVRAVPRAATSGTAGERDGALFVRVTAAPADGRANEALLRVLARALAVAPTDLRLESGRTSRMKTVSAPAATEPRLVLLCN
jgi:uncharacterized protein YggU (UPF0235/DUF167 family)